MIVMEVMVLLVLGSVGIELKKNGYMNVVNFFLHFKKLVGLWSVEIVHFDNLL